MRHILVRRAAPIVSPWLAGFLPMVMALLFAASAFAQSSPLRVVPGGGPAVTQGLIIGGGSVNTTIEARAGQRLRVALRSSNPDLILIITDRRGRILLSPDQRQRSFSGTIRRDGALRIAIAFADGARRRSATYQLSVELSRGPGGGTGGGTGGGFPMPPDGGSSSRDLYRVVGIGANETLNVRTGPGANFQVVAELTPGTRRLRLGPCRRTGSTQWCQIETTRGIPVQGWVNARYLGEDR